MSNYKINKDYKAPSDEKIRRAKNFSSILRETQQVHKPWYVLKNIYRKPKLLRLVILLVLVILAFLLIMREEATSEKQKTQDKNEIVNPDSVRKDDI